MHTTSNTIQQESIEIIQCMPPPRCCQVNLLPRRAAPESGGFRCFLMLCFYNDYFIWDFIGNKSDLPPESGF